MTLIEAKVIPMDKSSCGHEQICDITGNNCYCPVCAWCVENGLDKNAGRVIRDKGYTDLRLLK